MNRLFLIMTVLLIPYISWAQTYISDNDTTAIVEYRDGKQWAYRNIDGITVGMANEEFKDDYGHYYQIGVYISNNQDSTLLFNPEKVFADLLSNKGDTISLEVYTNEKYQKKIKNAHTLAMALYGLSAGLNSASAAYKTTYNTNFSPDGYVYTSINTSYDANAARQANMAANMQLQALNDKMKNDRAAMEQGYLKLNSIHCGDAIIGYMNIKHKKGKRLLVSIYIGDRTFSYLWDVEKNKKK